MSWPVLPHGFLGSSSGDNDTYRIERSLRFNSADSAYLSRTPASASNRKTWTWSGWVKRVALGSRQGVFVTSTAAGGDYVGLEFLANDKLGFISNDNSGVEQFRLETNAAFRDPSAWYHIVVFFNTSQATASNRAAIYVNNVLQSYSTATYMPQNYDGRANLAVQHNLGSWLPVAGLYFNGYLTEINFIDGQALTPSSFGETDAITGRWKAKAYSGTYGTNGFYLKFADNSGTTSTTLGKDSSPNGNNWTPNNFSVTAGAGNDSLVDSPTNYGTDTGVGGEVRGNYATLNPLGGSTRSTYSNGNLQVSGSGANLGDFGSSYSSIGVKSGKWYAEFTYLSGGLNASVIGVGSHIYTRGTANQSGYINGITAVNLDASSSTDRAIIENGTQLTGGDSGFSFSVNDIIGVAFDAGARTVNFYKNGSILGSTYPYDVASVGAGDFYFITCTRVISGTSSFAANFGQRPFAYTAPSGFKALCTTNLPQPTIQKPSSAMDVVTYTGNGSARSIAGLGFSPDLVWIKGRSGATDHAIYDSVRGVQLDLVSNSTAAETTQSQGVTAFNSDGFSIGTLAKLNTNTSTYVAWAWDEAPIAGMDIVSFVSPSGTTQSTVGHNLGVAPKMIIAKNRDTSANNWAVFHSSVCDTTSKFLQLNTTAALQTFATVWGASLPTSSVFGVTGGGVAASGVNCIAYLFAEVEGFSKFGSYTGNGSADGPFVFTGMRPRWVMTKRTSVADSWQILDTQRNTFNTSTQTLAANLSDAEYTRTTTDLVDFNSNGFKVRASNAAVNASGGTYIFAAFAESPFKYARAR